MKFLLNALLLIILLTYGCSDEDIVVDDEPPTIELVSPENNSFHAFTSATEPLSIEFNLADNEALESAQLTIKNEDGEIVLDEHYTYSSTNAKVLESFLPEVSGRHEIELEVTDKQGNTVSIDPIVVNLFLITDDELPTIEVVSPENDAIYTWGWGGAWPETETLTIDFNVEDNIELDQTVLTIKKENGDVVLTKSFDHSNLKRAHITESFLPSN